MISADTSHRLDASRFELALSLLESEVRSASISRLARGLFAILRIIAYLLPLWIAAYLVVRALGDDRANWAFGLQSGIAPLIALLATLLIFNAPLARKAWRQHRLARKMRALDLLEDGFAKAGAGRWRRLRTAFTLAAPLGLLAMSLRTLGSGQATWGERAVVLSICVALPVSLILFDRLLQRLKRRIDYFREVSAVRASLGSGGDGDNPHEIELSRRLASRIDSIESHRMLRRREAAIRRAQSTRAGDYGVAKSVAAREAVRRLDGAQRLLLEEALEILASAPDSAAAEEEGGRRALAVPGTELTVLYALDETARRIDVLAVVQTDPGPLAEGASS